jgi:PhnB protein
MTKVKAIPERYHSITPNLVCRDTAGAIEFYKKVFGATEAMRALTPDGKVMHAELQIGDSIFFVNDSMTQAETGSKSAAPHPIYLHVYFEDVDTIFKRAVAAGANVLMPLNNMFWGDRYAKIADPYGQHWGIATHVEDVSPEEMDKRQKALFSKAAS